MRTRTVPRIHTHESMRPVMSACVKIARQQLALLSARLEPQSLIKSFSLWNEMLMGNVPAEPNSRHTYKQNWDILPIYWTSDVFGSHDRFRDVGYQNPRR